MIYYIADLHFCHKNVIHFDSRPFPDTDYMNEYLIQSWNGRVTPDDTVYVLGDAFWKNEEESLRIMQRLNGHKHLIKGNHDRVQGRLRFHWESIQDYAEINDDGRLVILSHYPNIFTPIISRLLPLQTALNKVADNIRFASSVLCAFLFQRFFRSSQPI